MDSKVSDFLESKVQVYMSDLDDWRGHQHGLRKAVSSGCLAIEDYHKEMFKLDKKYKPVLEELEILKKQRRTLEQDVEDAYEDQKRQNVAREPSTEFMERAYASTIVTKVMLATGNTKKRSFDQSKFKKSVIAYLQARNPEDEDCVWCHLSGWWDSSDIKAAHLVPKPLQEDELTHLFGVDKVVLSDPRNGITLHKNIEKGLDAGVIAIVPVPPVDDTQKTKWKCILVDEASRTKTWSCVCGIVSKWGELDGKELVFRSENRPARRYLYFRFIITYLHAKKEGYIKWVERIANRNAFWPSPGLYLEKTTLLSLWRNISGLELPAPLHEGNTFNSAESADYQDLMLAARLRGIIIGSVKETKKNSERGREDFWSVMTD